MVFNDLITDLLSLQRKRKGEPLSDDSKSSSSSSEERESPPAEKKLKQEVTDTSDKLTNGTEAQTLSATSSKVVSKVATQVPSKDSTKLRGGSSASVVAKKATEAINSSFKKATDDPSAREAYKALFHSADKERPKEKSAHWVTFFPYH